MQIWFIPTKIAFKWSVFKVFIDISQKHLVEQRSKKYRMEVILNSFCLSGHT